MSPTSQTREVAIRCFATEFNDATHSFKKAEGDMEPNYNLLPTGTAVNRVYAVGTLTQTEDASQQNSDGSYWKGQITDTTGKFFVYAGEYEADARHTLQAIDEPAYVGIVGKPRTWEGTTGSTNVAIRPEEIVLSDSGTRDEWIRETAEQTLDRIDSFHNHSAPDGELARDVYDIDPQLYTDQIVEAVQSATRDETGEPDESDESDATSVSA